MTQMAQSGLLELDPICCEVGISRQSRELLLGLGEDPKDQIISMAEDAVHHRRWHENLFMV
jgi:hypothetical protein